MFNNRKLELSHGGKLVFLRHFFDPRPGLALLFGRAGTFGGLGLGSCFVILFGPFEEGEVVLEDGFVGDGVALVLHAAVDVVHLALDRILAPEKVLLLQLFEYLEDGLFFLLGILLAADGALHILLAVDFVVEVAVKVVLVMGQ